MSRFFEALRLAKEITFHPKEATKLAASNQKELWMYLLSVGLVYSVLYGVVAYVMSFFLASDQLTGALLGASSYGLLQIPISLVSITVGVMIGAVILHAFGKLFGIYKKDLLKTTTAMAYGISPLLFFGWLPGLNIVGGIWSFIVQIYALSNQQGISKLKAFVSMLIPAVIVVGIIIALSVLFAITLIQPLV
jgi:hypothetical protein